MPKSIKTILRQAAQRNKKKTKQRQQKNNKQKSKFKSNSKSKSKSNSKSSKWKSSSSNSSKYKNNSKSPSFKHKLKELQHKQNNRIINKSQLLQRKQQKQAQRKKDLYRKNNPKSLEYLRAKKDGDPKQLKGFKSKLTILQMTYFKQSDPNEIDETFRDSYFAAKINKMSTINRSIEMNILKESLGPFCASLPHILLHKKKIFKIIIDFINNEAHRYILHDAVGYVLIFYTFFKCFSD